MKKTLLRAVVMAVLMSTAAVPAAHAADKVGKEVGTALQAAQKAMAAQDWAGALAAVKQAQAVQNQNPYETYEINKFLTVVAINTQDYATATTAAEAAADSPAMPDEEKKDMYHNALLLATQNKQYDKAVVYGQGLVQINALDDSLAAALAEDYYYTKDYANAQKYAQQSVDLAKAAGKTPSQGAMEIIMSTQAKNNNQSGAQATLEQLALQYSDPDNWGQLVDLALSTKGINNQDALYLFRLKKIAGAMKQEDYQYVGTAAEGRGYPVEAREAFRAGGVSGAQATKAATEAGQDERALPQITAAAEKSKNGEEDVKLAEDLWGYGRYADVEAAARRAISKGGLKDPSEGNMMLGLALTAQGKYADAQTAFGAVTGSEARMKAAHLWSLYAQAQAKKAAPAAQPAAQPAGH